jgi:hypothetical protein
MQPWLFTKTFPYNDVEFSTKNLMEFSLRYYFRIKFCDLYKREIFKWNFTLYIKEC